MSTRLEDARNKIDEIDREMARLFAARMQAVAEVAKYKKATGKPVFDPAREDEVIRKNVLRLEEEALRPYYTDFIRAVMASSRRWQTRRLLGDAVAYQGVEGAFSHIAAGRLFPAGRLQAYPTFAGVIEAVESGEADVGVLPVENSTTGEVGEVLDLLFCHEGCSISGFYDLAVQQNLLALPGARLEDIKQVYSHPQALAQSADFLRRRGWELIARDNTAKAAQYVKKTGDVSKAAIASQETAELYGLSVLEKQINSSEVNTTRFILITRQGKMQGQRFSLFFTVKHDAGSLARVVDIIGGSGFNMESLRSRAMKSLPWQYYFHVEVDGALADETAGRMIERLGAVCESLRVLGCYSRLE